mgnify:CR=1 FL=1
MALGDDEEIGRPTTSPPSTPVMCAAARFQSDTVAWIPHYPFWALTIIAIDVFVIWALTVHGRDIVADA